MTSACSVSTTGANLPPATARAGQVLCIGEAMVLVASTDGRPLSRTDQCSVHVAGAESNVALYLADAQFQVSWLSAVGTDPFGDRIIDYLSTHGVGTSLVHRNRAHATGVSFKNVEDGETSVHYYRAGSAASRLTPEHLAPVREMSLAGSGPEVLHMSGITPALSPSCLALSEAAMGMAR